MKKTRAFQKINVCRSFYALLYVFQVKTVHPECSIVLHLQEKEAECQLKISLAQSLFNYSATNTGELSHISTNTQNLRNDISPRWHCTPLIGLFNDIVQPILLSFTMPFQHCVTDFLLWNTNII